MMGRSFRIISLKIILTSFSVLYGEDLTIASVFGNHMVFQQGVSIPVWGNAEPNDSLTITLGSRSIQTIVDEKGNWHVSFRKRRVSHNPIELAVRSKTGQIIIRDILVGEVWICTGQSNMEWPLSASDTGHEAIEDSNNNNLRLLNFKKGLSTYNVPYLGDDINKLFPNQFYSGEWKISSPESAAPFSGVGYFFGEKLQDELNVPVGLINVSVGGSPAEAWIRKEALASHPQLKIMVEGDWFKNKALEPWTVERGNENLTQAIEKGLPIPEDELGYNHPFKPGFLWEAGMKPMIQLPVSGVVWYQGESNAVSDWRVAQHESLLKLLIQDWREQFQKDDMPFLFVQLPGMKRPHWVEFRVSQQKVHDAVSNTGMAITMDVGNPTDVHPKRKQPVGDRLARIALEQFYGKNIISHGPTLKSKRFRKGKLELRFDHIVKGLKTKNGMPPTGFELMDEAGEWYNAEAKIFGLNKILLSNMEIMNPKAIRYGWSPYPEPALNLINSVGLPIAPFINYE